MSEAIEVYEHRGCEIKIYCDDNPMNPRTEYDNLSTMASCHTKYSLGDKGFDRLVGRDQAVAAMFDAIGPTDADCRGLVLKLIRDTGFRDEYRGWERGSYRDFVRERLEDIGIDKVLDMLETKAVIMPLYIYDHSGISISTNGFTCPWDSGKYGWAFITLDRGFKECGETDPEALRKRIRSWIEAEVETYDNYLTGQVYGYVVTAEDGDEDSCWGFNGDTKYVKAEAESAADALADRKHWRKPGVREFSDLMVADPEKAMKWLKMLKPADRLALAMAVKADGARGLELADTIARTAA